MTVDIGSARGDRFLCLRQRARCAAQLQRSLISCTLQASLPIRRLTIKKHPARGCFFMVDPRGIEPLSENPFTGPSSWVVCGLEFPLDGGHRQSPSAGSPFLHDRCKCEVSVHVHHYMTLRPGSWSSSGERAAKEPRHCLIRQPVRRYCQRLILRLSLFRDCSARHAYPASRSPSKPLRTLVAAPRRALLYYTIFRFVCQEQILAKPRQSSPLPPLKARSISRFAEALAISSRLS